MLRVMTKKVINFSGKKSAPPAEKILTGYACGRCPTTTPLHPIMGLGIWEPVLENVYASTANNRQQKVLRLREYDRSVRCPSVRPLTPISREAISLYLVDVFQ